MTYIVIGVVCFIFGAFFGGKTKETLKAGFAKVMSLLNR
jgi:hypothetical protein